MTVVNACLLDDAFSSLEARDALIAKDERRFAGVRQLAAVAGICNAAAFDESEMDQPADIRKVNGDATDSAILRFAESLRPVKDSNADWIEVYKVNFNSKTKFSKSHQAEMGKPGLTSYSQCSNYSSRWTQMPASLMLPLSRGTTSRMATLFFLSREVLMFS